MSYVATRPSIRSLHPLFVAEISGIDLTVPVTREDFRTIWEAFNEHQVLVFHDQPFDDETQMAFSRNFGAPEKMEAHAANNYMPGHIAVMTNADAHGNLLPLTDKSMVHRPALLSDTFRLSTHVLSCVRPPCAFLLFQHA